MLAQKYNRSLAVSILTNYFMRRQPQFVNRRNLEMATLLAEREKQEHVFPLQSAEFVAILGKESEIPAVPKNRHHEKPFIYALNESVALIGSEVRERIHDHITNRSFTVQIIGNNCQVVIC